jgi:hypothetical protein
VKAPPSLWRGNQKSFFIKELFVMSYFNKHNQVGQSIKNSRGQTIGYVQGERFTRIARSSRHQLRNPRGWSQDEVIIDTLELMGVKIIAIDDLDCGLRFTASITEYREYGINIDRGHGPQIVLPLNYWKVEPSPDTPKKKKRK